MNKAFELAIENERRFNEERDRRYAEVNLEREKAIKIKEQADKEALILAREIQNYKDEKANDLRSQIEQERGMYITRNDHQVLGDKLDSSLLSLNDKLDIRSQQTDARFTAVVNSISQIASRIDTTDGRTKGLTQGWQFLIGFVGLSVTVLTTISLIITIVR